MRPYVAALLFVACSVYAADVPIDTVNVPRETVVQLLQDNLALKARPNDLADQLDEAVKERQTCMESRSS